MSMRRHEIIQTVRPLNTWILFRLDFGPFVVNWGVNGTFESDFLLRHFVQLCILSIPDAIKRI